MRLLPDLIAAGVTPTPGGRLPLALVRQVQQRRPRWAVVGRRAGLEEDLPPLAALHDLMRHVGLLRLAKGVLRPLRAAADELEVVRRLRSWFPPEEFTALLVTDVIAMLAAVGPLTADALAGRLHPNYHRWSRTGRSLTQRDVVMSIHQQAAVMQGLDHVEVDGWIWSVGPAATRLLPRATAMAQLWTTGRHMMPSSDRSI